MSEEIKEVISPEGLEERVQCEYTFRVTLTQGGKYRLYAPVGKVGQVMPVEVCDDLEHGTRRLGECMGLMGVAIADPKVALQMILKSLLPQPSRTRRWNNTYALRRRGKCSS